MALYEKQHQYNSASASPAPQLHHPMPHQPRFYSVPPSALGLAPTPTTGNYTHQEALPQATYKPAVSYGQAYSTHNPPSPPAGTISLAAAAPQYIQALPRSAPPASIPSRETFRTPSPTPFAVQQQQHYQPQAHHYSPQRARTHIARSPVMLPPHLQLPSNSPEVAPENMRCTDFVAKLWFLLDRPAEYARHIRWTPSGTSFIFCPTNEFANEVLARLFKHSNVASFVRQLNLYGFQRISHLELLEDLQESPEESSSAPPSMQAFQESESPSMPASGFHHPDFRKDSAHSLGKIRPKPSPNRKRNTASAASKKRSRARAQLEEEEAGYELEDLPNYYDSMHEPVARRTRR